MELLLLFGDECVRKPVRRANTQSIRRGSLQSEVEAAMEGLQTRRRRHNVAFCFANGEYWEWLIAIFV